MRRWMTVKRKEREFAVKTYKPRYVKRPFVYKVTVIRKNLLPKVSHTRLALRARPLVKPQLNFMATYAINVAKGHRRQLIGCLMTHK